MRLDSMGHSLPYLLPTIEEKLVGIDTICDGASYERYPMKDDWWLIWIFEEKLVQNVEDDCEDDKRSETCSNNYTRRFVCKQILQRLSDNSKETHSLKRPKEDAEVLESARDCLQLIQRPWLLQIILGGVGIDFADTTPLASHSKRSHSQCLCPDLYFVQSDATNFTAETSSHTVLDSSASLMLLWIAAYLPHSKS